MEKVGKATWKMEKEGDMKVPAYIFANDKLIEGMGKDRTMGQLRNIAGLPGIIKHALLMPDGHEGYGFPIGGVAAFDAEEGIVSPGGVGYDINCLLPGTKITTSLGYTKPIESFEEEFSFVVQTDGTVLKQGKVSLKTGKEDKNAINFMSKKHLGKIYKIQTLGGTVAVTADHPLITPQGKKLPTEMNMGDTVLTYPFEGIEYEYCCEDENELAIYAKIIGYLTGDGTLTYSGKKYRTMFFGKRKDLEKIKLDVEKLGYNTHLRERTREHQIKRRKFTSTTAELHVYSQEFAKKLIGFGTPTGNKTKTKFRIPKWIKEAPLWIKRLYLAGFFGAELSSASTSSKTGFYMPMLSMNKVEELEADGREFFLDITEILEEFGVEVAKVAVVEKENKKIRLRLEIDGKEENVEKLYAKIGFEYNEERMVSALAAVLYIRFKKMYREKRDEIRTKVVEYKKKGFSLRELQKKFASEWANARFIERAYYENRSPRAPLSIPSFKEFLEKQREFYNIFGALVTNVLEIKEEHYEGTVYDFTVEEIHRFVADGVIVSNCGVRLLTTTLEEKEVRPKIVDLCNGLFKNVPSGVGSEGRLRIEVDELDEAVKMGVDWAIEKGYGNKEDKEHCEEYGRIAGADPGKTSPTAKKRGRKQFGTLGAGNHFLEVQVVEEIFNEEVASKFGLKKGMVTTMIHCGSRGYGHQICSDNIPPILDYARKNNLWLPDQELAYAPMKSKEAQDYMSAMRCAVNYAFTNRHIIAHWVRETYDQVFGEGTGEKIKTVYDVAHNIAKIEEHTVDGKKQKMVVHRKGATRAFPKGRPELPESYRDIGQPVLIPGSMGTASYVLVGNPKGLEVAWGSSCHGAGRTMSRGQAIRTHNGEKLRKELWDKNKIFVRATHGKVIAEEAPDAYKNIDDVVQSVADAGISDIVARLRPLGVAKG